MTLALFLAVLVPNLELHEQPYLPDSITARTAVVAELQEVMAEAEEATSEVLEAQEAARRAEPPEQQVAADVPWPWGALADCESGEWDVNADPIPGSRRWDYGAPGAFSRPGYDFEGGLNFAASTWTWVAGDLDLLSQYPRAFLAPPEVQVRVGQEVQRRQGWRAWPVCSRKLNLR